MKPNCKDHPTSIKGYDSLEELANDIGNLRYKELAGFLKNLTAKIEKDAMKDKANGRLRLAMKLNVVGCRIKGAAQAAWGAWKISEPYMAQRKFKRINKTKMISKHRIYGIWAGIRSRCLNPKNASYRNYGGRGIKICEEWKNDCAAFIDYATKLPNYNPDKIGRRKGQLSLDRINNDGHYELGNIRWATQSQQFNNSRNPYSDLSIDNKTVTD